MSSNMKFTKDNLDLYLKELSKEYRKRNRHATYAELILVGGAAVLTNYGFREMTTDIDAIIHAESSMTDAINTVGDKYHLPTGWINIDLKKTDSFSSKLVEHSEYYKTFSNIVEIRTVRAEYLIAMKLVAGRKYKKDLSDIVGILNEQTKSGNTVTYDMIDHAVLELYGNWDKINDYNIKFLKAALASDNLSDLFDEVMNDELSAKAAVIDIESKYPDIINEDNVDDIISKALEKRN